MVKKEQDSNSFNSDLISEQIKAPQPNQPKILIIDDEKLLRNSMQKILERVGMYVDTASDYQTALQALQGQVFDILLVDIILPKMSGIQLITRLQEELNLNSAIIFITGEPNLENAVQALKIGAMDYLEKPVSKEVLIDSILKTLSRSKAKIEMTKETAKKTFNIKNISNENNQEDLEKNSIMESLDNIDKIHKALVELKKKYGEALNEDQRNLLNTISKCNANLSRLLKKND